MKLELESLESTERSIEIVIPANDLDLDADEAKLSGDVRFTGTAKRNAAETTVKGSIAADVIINCSKCLSPVERKLEIEFRSKYLASDVFNKAGNHELDIEELDADAISGEYLDLNEVVREQILLSLPEIVLCSEKCKGLCPLCCTNLNQKVCNCLISDTDPRWAALKDLR